MPRVGGKIPIILVQTVTSQQHPSILNRFQVKLIILKKKLLANSQPTPFINNSYQTNAFNKHLDNSKQKSKFQNNSLKAPTISAPPVLSNI